MSKSLTASALGLGWLLLLFGGDGLRAQPLQLPGAQPFNAPGAHQGGAAGSEGQAQPRQPSMPAIRIPGEEGIIGQTLRRHGGAGAAVLTKTTTGFGLKLDVAGFQRDNPLEPCVVSFGDQPVPVTSLGRPAGVPRYRLEAPVCPIVFDVLGGSFLVVEPAEPCLVEAAACRIDPRGLWGPDSRTLVSRAREIEQARGTAERAVREGYKALSARADAVEQRSIAREQAGFSGERELICRDFQREGQLGFCGARITEARAAALRARLGLSDAKPAAARPRPAAPKPGSGPGTGPGPLQLGPRP